MIYVHIKHTVNLKQALAYKGYMCIMCNTFNKYKYEEKHGGLMRLQIFLITIIINKYINVLYTVCLLLAYFRTIVCFYVYSVVFCSILSVIGEDVILVYKPTFLSTYSLQYSVCGLLHFSSVYKAILMVSLNMLPLASPLNITGRLYFLLF